MNYLIAYLDKFSPGENICSFELDLCLQMCGNMADLTQLCEVGGDNVDNM